MWIKMTFLLYLVIKRDLVNISVDVFLWSEYLSRFVVENMVTLRPQA